MPKKGVNRSELPPSTETPEERELRLQEFLLQHPLPREREHVQTSGVGATLHPARKSGGHQGYNPTPPRPK